MNCIFQKARITSENYNVITKICYQCVRPILLTDLKNSSNNNVNVVKTLTVSEK